MLPPLLSPKAKSSCFASWSTSTGQAKLLVQGDQTGVRRGNRLSRKQPAGKKPFPFSTLANGLVHLGLVSSLGLGEWWKCKSCESQIHVLVFTTSGSLGMQELWTWAGCMAFGTNGPWP